MTTVGHIQILCQDFVACKDKITNEKIIFTCCINAYNGRLLSQ